MIKFSYEVFDIEIKNMIIAALGLIATVVIAYATVVTTRLVKIQCRIAKKQRKDNLFKIRYEFYLEILEFIKNFEPHFVKTARIIKSLKLKKEIVKDGSYTRLKRQIHNFFYVKHKVPYSSESLVKKA